MKKMISIQMGGACDQEFIAETFEDMATMSQTYGKKCFLSNMKIILKCRMK